MLAIAWIKQMDVKLETEIKQMNVSYNMDETN